MLRNKVRTILKSEFDKMSPDQRSHIMRLKLRGQVRIADFKKTLEDLCNVT